MTDNILIHPVATVASILATVLISFALAVATLAAAAPVEHPQQPPVAGPCSSFGDAADKDIITALEVIDSLLCEPEPKIENAAATRKGIQHLLEPPHASSLTRMWDSALGFALR
jgi:hypothetical protein